MNLRRSIVELLLDLVHNDLLGVILSSIHLEIWKDLFLLEETNQHQNKAVIIQPILNLICDSFVPCFNNVPKLLEPDIDLRI